MSDITGNRYGKLVVVEKVQRPADYTGGIQGTWWRCRCDCGKEKILPRQCLTGGTNKSCGCIRRHPPKSTAKPTKTPEQIREDKAKAGRARAAQLRGKVTNFRMGGGTQISKEDKKMLNGISKLCKCAQCGKVFERLSSEWTYKDTKRGGHIRWFCSYKCWRAVDEPRKPHGNSMKARAAEG